MNDYNINILVNGNKCKKFYHLAKTFIEAKRGSEYAIEIKNNERKRILAVCSVDGLNILNGKPATEDGPGYVLDNFSSAVFDGFRVSDDKVAKFVFDYKGSSYASSKNDGSEKNVGIIGIRIFDEKVVPLTKIVEHHHHHNHYDWTPKPDPWTTPVNPPWISPYITWGTPVSDGPTYTCNASNMTGEALGANTTMDMADGFQNCSQTLSAKSMRCCDNSMKISKQLANSYEEPIGFDMGTKWGDAKESRVREVTFERGIIVLSTNIYYASRQSLLEMGVPLGNEKQVNFPNAFADSKYATPPSGWRG